MITLKTLPTATKQEIFDQVSKHLLNQKQQSGDSNLCRYRSLDGLKCAAGCLIDVTEYDESMEGKTWEQLANANIVPKENMDLIISLQRIHDINGVSLWKYKLEELAEMYGLENNF